MTYDLECRYDTRQSFYGKAEIRQEEKDNLIINNLYSYGTLVARITKNEETCLSTCELIPYKTLNGRIKTQTTTRHQKEFFKQNGLTDFEIKELFKNGEMVKEV